MMVTRVAMVAKYVWKKLGIVSEQSAGGEEEKGGDKSTNPEERHYWNETRHLKTIYSLSVAPFWEWFQCWLFARKAIVDCLLASSV